MEKRYIVRLTDEERRELQKLVSTGKAVAYKIKHANILLKVDADGPNWTDERTAQAFSRHVNTVANVRRRFVEQGLEAALGHKKQKKGIPRVVNGEVEVRIIALRCGPPPAGHAPWALRLLAERVVELEIVPCISHETVRQVLKNELRSHLKEYYVIPPEQDAAFVGNMGDILDLYHLPYDPQRPAVCMDEQPVQMIKETRKPLVAQLGQPERFDYEYERNGTASLFLFTEPLVGWRQVSVRERRTAVDWAEEIQHLLEEQYPEAEKVVFVCDNLNTHTIASLYQAFLPEKARVLAKRLEIHYTPKHGSWLNIAEIELSALTRLRLDRRIPDLDTLKRETQAWYVERNASEKPVDWQFTTADARIRLKHLYQQIRT